MNLKMIYFTVIFLQTETIAILLLYCFLVIYNKELVVFYGFFLSLEAKVDCSQSCFPYFFPLTKERKRRLFPGI